ncbi:hypothetical protein O181_095636 [Austropuccinia psidii MF-1]|uniref:Uncharacterized protein n=1 Tax=Austropuccinia psidii MF-1 TaxID=1389203 RepID=A0A9Q3PDH7_9BASI|nr:hypothetical protein [Austropuccinia psidii MF-1]
MNCYHEWFHTRKFNHCLNENLKILTLISYLLKSLETIPTNYLIILSLPIKSSPNVVHPLFPIHLLLLLLQFLHLLYLNNPINKSLWSLLSFVFLLILCQQPPIHPTDNLQHQQKQIPSLSIEQ